MANVDEEKQIHRVRGNTWMRDDSEVEWKSWLVPIFFILNLVLFIVTMYTNDCPSYHGHGHGCLIRFLGRFSFEPFHQNPFLGPSSTTLLKMGGLDGNHHQVWRLITAIWLHTGLIHLIINSLSLLCIGMHLEHQFGFVKMSIIYVLAGVSGNMASCLFDPAHVSVGASSAALGLIGSLLAELLTNWPTYANKLAAGITLVMTLTINIVVAILPYHGHFSHAFGGFLAGFLLGFVLLAKKDIMAHVWPNFKPYQIGLGITSLVLLIIGYIVGLVMLFHTKAKH